MKVEGHTYELKQNILRHIIIDYPLSGEERELLSISIDTFFTFQTAEDKILITLLNNPLYKQSFWYMAQLQLDPESTAETLDYLIKKGFIKEKPLSEELEEKKLHLTVKGNDRVITLAKHFIEGSEIIQEVLSSCQSYKYTPRTNPQKRQRSNQTNRLFSTVAPKNPDMYNRILEAYDKYIQTDDGPEEDLIQMADDMERALGIPFDQIPNLGDKIRIHMYTPIQMCKTSALKTNNTRTFNKIFGPLEQEIKKKK